MSTCKRCGGELSPRILHTRYAREEHKDDRELRSYVRDDKDIHQDTVMALGLAEQHAVFGQLRARRKGRGRVIEVGSGAPGRYADTRRALGRSG